MALGCGFVRMRGERSEGIEGKNFEISNQLFSVFLRYSGKT